MGGFVKFFIGAALTALVAYGADRWGHVHTAFLDKIDSKVQTALGESAATTVQARMQRDPDMRIVILSGNADAATRDALTRRIAAIPGVASVQWENAPSTDAVANPAQSAPSVPMQQ